MPRPAQPFATARSARRVPVRAASFAAVAAAAACGGRDPFAPDPALNRETVETTFLVYPLSTSAPIFASAIDLFNLRVLRPGVTVSSNAGLVANFDFAVDRGGDGRVRLLPSKLVAGVGGSGRVLRTGFQVTSVPFDSLADAPGGTYQSDSATVILPGQTVAVETESLSCFGGVRTLLYAKLSLDSVSTTTGGVYLRARVDPNCGFRSLRPGKPSN